MYFSTHEDRCYFSHFSPDRPSFRQIRWHCFFPHYSYTCSMCMYSLSVYTPFHDSCTGKEYICQLKKRIVSLWPLLPPERLCPVSCSSRKRTGEFGCDRSDADFCFPLPRLSILKIVCFLSSALLCWCIFFLPILAMKS